MLNEILEACREQLKKDQETIGINQLSGMIKKASSPLSLSRALLQKRLGLIAEIKGSSPSKGKLRTIDDPRDIARIYESVGASAISVLTEPNYFSGRIDFLQMVRESANLPVLRKDFIFDRFQLYQARAYGADAVLLMTEVVTDDQELSTLIEEAHLLGLEVLLESSSKENLSRSLKTKADVLGINNRDFYTLNVDINNSLDLISRIQVDRPIISESGIFTRDDVMRVEKAGFNGILVGTSLMESGDIRSKVHELLGT